MSSQLFKFKFSKTPAAGDQLSAQRPESKTMSEDTFVKLRDVIYKKCGIYYTESKKYLLEGRISKRLIARKLGSFEEYIGYLDSPGGRQELNDLFEAITINETYFFRAQQQFEAFENIIVPEILKPRMQAPNPVLRLWSAAASTGEEAYTLAMLVLEKLKPQYPRVQFQILASDINNAVLNTARKGIYKEYSVRNVPEPYMKKYFRQSGSTYILSDEVKKMVKFLNINLYDAYAMRTISSCDVIFCCNVLIYFDVPSKQQVISHLYDSLNQGGYLFIGYSESLHGISKAFKLVHLPKAMAYKKE
ncbi:MAG: CheR family methyltransferase [Candidatus Kapaibacterium sp.]